MMEVWRDIPGYERHYQVSSAGRVRSVKRTPRILKTGFQPNGYERVCLWMDGQKKSKMVHRLVASAFIANPKNCTDINHMDEDKANNDVSNLEWCDHRYNMNYGSVRAKIAEANRCRVIREATRRKLSLDTSRRRWINDGLTERYVYVEDVDSCLASGWQRGRIRKRRKSHV